MKMQLLVLVWYVGVVVSKSDSKTTTSSSPKEETISIIQNRTAAATDKVMEYLEPGSLHWPSGTGKS